ncbi:MAG: type I DNA topoisomerase [Burkholderiales bacterium]
MSKNLLIVESPSKATTLKKYLGSDFEIVASYGHVRDLEAKEGAVDPLDNFHMRYVLVDKNRKHVDVIAKAVGKATNIYLATDPDREGEAIAWHLAEILKEKKLLKNRKLHRVVFYEITESAVKEAVAHPRSVSMPLINAQQARRALDHLVGFNLSPLLWKKIGPGLSAGRVQSPALRLIAERESEIENFKSLEYWTLHLDSHKEKQKFAARLIQFKGEKVEQFTFVSGEQQSKVVAELEKAAKGSAKVVRVERKPKNRQPAAPFTTSTLQQEAVRKLGMTSRGTMSVAQQLYEGVDIGGTSVGLITYMRTDSVALAAEATKEIRDYIRKKLDPEYLPAAAVQYRNKSKNAQEAHEAIRPTSAFRTPDSIRKYLKPEQAALYEMIWKRTVASQMTAAKYETTAVDISAGLADTLFRATGQVLVFPGFMAVYLEDADDAESEDEGRLPLLEEKESIPVDRIHGEQHFTQPPPRYTEASLVKTLEEFGIGRPSTYASIISTLQDRGYALLEKKRFMPTDVGRLVNGFLTSHFAPYVDYGFTASLEEELDDISNGDRDWVPVLKEFWKDFSKNLKSKEKVARGSPLSEDCPKCKKQLFLQNSRRGVFVGCSGYPECDYTRPWGDQPQGPVVLGTDPKTTLEVLLLKGPYGFYVQLGQTPEDKLVKPKRAAWPKNIPAASADIETALKLLALPRQLGTHPETAKPVEASIGRFGPYVKHDGAFKSIPKAENVHDVTLQRAVELLAEKKSSAGGGRSLGQHPEDKKVVAVYNGRYGPYVKHGKTNATLPASMDPEKVTLAEALKVLSEKTAKKSPKKPPTKTAKPAPKPVPKSAAKPARQPAPKRKKKAA